MEQNKESKTELREKIVLLILTILVFLSRVPFLGPGYGLDADSWRIVNTGRMIALTGAYSASRLPGFPLPEMVYSFIWNCGPSVLNGVTAFLSASAFLFFALSLRKLGSGEYLLAAFAMAFTPVIYVNSTTSMDYVWALAFILGSFYFVLENKPAVAGIFLGLGTASRITSSIVLLPLCIIVYYQMNQRIKYVLQLCASAFLLTMLMFLPVIRHYGWHFLSFSEYGYPDILVILNRASNRVWGILGFSAMILSLFIHRRNFNFRKHPPLTITIPVALGSLIAICLYTIVYLRLPHEAGYLIPVVPFTILLLNGLLPKKSFTVVSIAIIVSSFFLSLDKSGIHLQGEILRDHGQRVGRTELIESTIVIGSGLPEETAIVSGSYLPQIEVRLAGNSQEIGKYVYLLNASELKGYIDRGYRIYYLPEVDKYNLQIHGIDLGDAGEPILNATGRY